MDYLDEHDDDIEARGSYHGGSTHKPWYRGFMGRNTALDALRKVAATLSESYNIKIDIRDDKDAVAHSNNKTNTITLGTKGIYTKGSDYYVGLLLHEIGHIRHSPQLDEIDQLNKFKNPIIAKSIYNMLEDRRIEEKMKDDYSGAHLYLDEMNKDLFSDVKNTMGSNLYGSEKTINDWLDEMVHREDRKGTFGIKEDRAKKIAEFHEVLKEALLYKTCGLAIMMAESATEYDSSTTCNEADIMAGVISEDIVKATDSNLDNADIQKLTMHVLRVLDPLIPSKQHSEDKQKAESQGGGQSGEGEGEEGEGGAAKGHNPAKMFSQFAGGGRGTVASDGSTRSYRNNWFTQADEKIRSQADSVKRKLVAVMRDNERARYVGGKRKGLLNKKSLNRVARDNYRIYRKRFEAKGKKYAVAIVQDCSGSMWASSEQGTSEEYKIRSAHQTTALFIRVFRALGFPTGLTIYGHQAKTVLNPRDRYVVSDVNERIEGSDNNYYESGGNETYRGIQNALTYLDKVGAGCQKLMIIITDGGLDYSDVRASKALLEKEIKKGNFSPMIFYVESNEKILDNPDYEAHIPDPSSQLAEQAVRLMKKVVSPLQDIT